MEDKEKVKTELLPLVYYGLLWIICYVTLAISFLGIQLFLMWTNDGRETIHTIART